MTAASCAACRSATPTSSGRSTRRPRSRSPRHVLSIFSLWRVRRRASRDVAVVADSSTISSSSALRPIPPDGRSRRPSPTGHALVQVEADPEQGEEPEEDRQEGGQYALDQADGYVAAGPDYDDADDEVDDENDADRPLEYRPALPSARAWIDARHLPWKTSSKRRRMGPEILV